MIDIFCTFGTEARGGSKPAPLILPISAAPYQQLDKCDYDKRGRKREGHCHPRPSL